MQSLKDRRDQRKREKQERQNILSGTDAKVRSLVRAVQENEREAQSQLTNVKEARDRIKLLKSETRSGGTQGCLKATSGLTQEVAEKAERCVSEIDEPSPSNFAYI